MVWPARITTRSPVLGTRPASHVSLADQGPDCLEWTSGGSAAAAIGPVEQNATIALQITMIDLIESTFQRAGTIDGHPNINGDRHSRRFQLDGRECVVPLLDRDLLEGLFRIAITTPEHILAFDGFALFDCHFRPEHSDRVFTGPHLKRERSVLTGSRGACARLLGRGLNGRKGIKRDVHPLGGPVVHKNLTRDGVQLFCCPTPALNERAEDYCGTNDEGYGSGRHSGITSPPSRVAINIRVVTDVLVVRKRTLPSPIATFAPLVWKPKTPCELLQLMAQAVPAGWLLTFVGYVAGDSIWYPCT